MWWPLVRHRATHTHGTDTDEPPWRSGALVHCARPLLKAQEFASRANDHFMEWTEWWGVLAKCPFETHPSSRPKQLSSPLHGPAIDDLSHSLTQSVCVSQCLVWPRARLGHLSSEELCRVINCLWQSVVNVHFATRMISPFDAAQGSISWQVHTIVYTNGASPKTLTLFASPWAIDFPFRFQMIHSCWCQHCSTFTCGNLLVSLPIWLH